MTGFSNMFWGFLIILLDFRIDGFDIIPDFIGYWMIYIGLGELSTWNVHFKAARKYVPILGILAVLDSFQFQRPINEFSLEPMVIGGFILGLVLSVIDLLMVYNICKGISEIAEKSNLTDLSLKAMNRWQLYLYVKIGFMIIWPFMLISPGFVVVLGIPISLLVIIVGFMLAFLMKDADTSYNSASM